jgi:hypothetical protein
MLDRPSRRPFDAGFPDEGRTAPAAEALAAQVGVVEGREHDE